MTIVRISIRRSLVPGTYSFRQAPGETFSSEYMVCTAAPFPSDQLRDYAKAIARAESRLYPTSVRFDSALVKLATPGASPESLHGQFSNVDLEKLGGQFELPEGDALAFPPVTAVFVRQAIGGRNGRLLLPHVLTASEWLHYTQKQTLPARFQKVDPLDFQNHIALNYDLLEVIRDAGGSYVMPGGEGDTALTLRRITGFVFLGFDAATAPKRRKKSTASKRAALRRALLTATDPAGEVTAELAPQKTVSTQGVIPGVVYLLQAGNHFKIGKSIDFTKRLTQIKLQLPYPVQVVHTIKAANPTEVESHWHRRFAAQRCNGEWFELTPADVEEFKGVSNM